MIFSEFPRRVAVKEKNQPQVENKKCPNNCGHERRVHSKNGCEMSGCWCTARYMDF